MSKEVVVDLSSIISPEDVAKFLEMLAGMVMYLIMFVI